MLSPSAFNALLKVMEEPPDYVTFILATTEIHKVPATILSRCQRYDFRRIRSEDIVNRLLYIAQQESITLDADAAALIAKVSDGGMRDAISYWINVLHLHRKSPVKSLPLLPALPDGITYFPSWMPFCISRPEPLYS